MVAHTFDPGTQAAEADGSLGVRGQPSLLMNSMTAMATNKQTNWNKGTCDRCDHNVKRNLNYFKLQ